MSVCHANTIPRPLKIHPTWCLFVRVSVCHTHTIPRPLKYILLGVCTSMCLSVILTQYTNVKSTLNCTNTVYTYNTVIQYTVITTAPKIKIPKYYNWIINFLVILITAQRGQCKPKNKCSKYNTKIPKDPNCIKSIKMKKNQ